MDFARVGDAAGKAFNVRMNEAAEQDQLIWPLAAVVDASDDDATAIYLGLRDFVQDTLKMFDVAELAPEAVVTLTAIVLTSVAVEYGRQMHIEYLNTSENND